ncbi:MAG: RecQ family ATP-dependent DNA helicase [Bacteroidales bacterium]|nr:RecQ family ATP-dependent DNA helicase [Bacteroidales bacterium]
MDNSAIIHQILKKYWGYDTFRPLQEDIILSVLDNRDTMALLPTGGGKSICFQVPAMAKPGLCIVISPLIALMKDQVQNLKKKGIKAAAIYSGMNQQQIRTTLDNCLFDKDLKFLYLSPERLKTELFRVNLQRMNLSMIAVDEAHCISQWGYDFRPPYLEIAEIRPLFPQVPVLALTATATPEVVKDIQEKLLFKKENVFQKSFKRDNLTYYVVKEQDKNGRMLRIIQRYPGTGIVYVRNRRKTQETAEFLKRHGISADFYHAGLDSTERDRKQQEWMEGTTRIIVSTNAFGMGIDKPDVRFVIHIDIPDTLEGYFQEAGRGGRDLQPSIAVMLYDDSDLKELQRNFKLSFPPIQFIQQVYNDLCNKFRVPIHEGQDQSFPLDVGEFATEHHYNPVEVFNAIQLMEKTGAVQFDTDRHEPARLTFLMTKEDFDLQKKSATFQKEEEFVKLLLRSYSGLFSRYVVINEKELARRAELTPAQVVAKLMYLKKYQFIDYQPSNQQPRLYFVTNRVDEKHLFYDPDIYYRRKQVAEKRVEAVEHYVLHHSVCRSQLLLSYFGEKQSDACGKCDICLKKAHDNLKKLEFEKISAAVRNIYPHCQDIKMIVSQLCTQFEEDKIVEVVRWLIDQKKI